MLLAMTRFKEANIDPSSSQHYHTANVDNLLPLHRLLQHPTYQYDAPVMLAALSVRSKSLPPAQFLNPCFKYGLYLFLQGFDAHVLETCSSCNV